MLATIQELWHWAILISAGLRLLSGFVLTSTIPRIINQPCLPLESAAQKQAFNEEYSLLSEPPGVMADRCVVPYYTPESSGVIVYVMSNRGEVLRWRSPEPFQALGQAQNGGSSAGLDIDSVRTLGRG